MFPCWDEPALKATFELTLISKKGFKALSNTLPVEEKDLPDEGWQLTRFEPTPKMSTYLVCCEYHLLCTMYGLTVWKKLLGLVILLY